MATDGKGRKAHGKTEIIPVKGMVCASCEKIISRQVQRVHGVKEVKADYVKGVCEVTYDGDKGTYDRIRSAIEEKGYSCSTASPMSLGELLPIAAIVVLLIGAYLLIDPVIETYAPSIGKDVSIPLLFIIGLFTGFHCIAMCGGFVVSYTAQPGSSYLSHIKYGAAKTLSYALFGAIFGFIGSLITFTPLIRGVAAVLAGLFLMVFGLNMLGFNILRSMRLNTPSFVTGRIGSSTNPATIGFLNGLMIACGPLQAIYLLAAASGSPYIGALYLLAFGLGTLPLLLGFGLVTSFLSLKMTNKILKYSGAVVLLLGLVMINRGIALTGTGYDVNTVVAAVQPGIGVASSGESVEMDSDGSQIIRMNVTAYGWQPDRFVLKKGVPVKWIIDGQQITSCNSAIQVPKYGLKFSIKKGTQTITFTPTEAGTVPWSCWMGMIPGTFIVKEDVQTTGAGAQSQVPTAQAIASPETLAASPTTTLQARSQETTTTTQPDVGETTASTQSKDQTDSGSAQTIYMNVTAAGWEPSQFVLRTGVPVKWVIDGQQITGCNSAIKVPSLGLQFNIKKGLQTVEFTPTEAGNIQWSCWMGMIKGVFVVKDGVDPQNQAQLQQALASAPPIQRGGGSCGMMNGGGGGCGCGMMGG